jgi:hypothetical protein
VVPGSDAVVINNGEAMVMDREAVVDAPTLSVTLTVKAGTVPGVDGVPLMRPLLGFRLKPAGRVPDKIDT